MFEKYLRPFTSSFLFVVTASAVFVSAASGQITGEPRVSPTPAATATPADRVQTLEELQSKIRQRMFDPDVRRGRVGIKAVSLATGKVVFENDSEKYFVPASNMKSVTVAAALERLGPDFRFVTSVFAAALPDANGVITGDLRIYGRGDISISTAFFGTSSRDPETYYKGIDRLVDKIVAAGVKRIEGNIVGDESHFRGNATPLGWEWDDLQWYYGAEISALPINDNAIDVSVRPGSVGSPCVVTISPPNTLVQVSNRCMTGSSSRTFFIKKALDRNVIEIGGTMPVGEGFSGSITFSRPGDLFVELLKLRLKARGVVITGAPRLGNPSEAQPRIEIAKLESPQFREIAAKTMKPSQNLYTETILWTMGEQSRTSGSIVDSSNLGINVVKGFLSSIGVIDGVVQYDGSGLSRHNLIAPAALVTLYNYMSKQSRNSQAWRDSLTIGGVDGTLGKRFKGTAAFDNMRGKTGTMDQVSTLSGYVTTAAGEQLVVSIMVNGVANVRDRISLIDDVVVSLANFNGRVD